MKNYLTIDLGRTKLRYAVISDELDVIASGNEYTTIETKEGVFDPIRKVTDQYREMIEGVSVTMPGVIDNEKGIAYSGGVYQWVKDFPYAQELSEYIDMPVAICNDAKAAALAELGYGALKRVENGVLMMILATGIGGAVITNGKLLSGQHHAAGEFSYIKGDYRQRDGNRDMFALSSSLNCLSACVETTSGRKNLNILRIMGKINAGDKEVEQGVRNYCDMLATYIYNIQCVIDADVFVLGGNITDEPAMMRMIKEAIHNKFETAVYHNIFEPKIKTVVFHSNSRMYGAVYNFRQNFEKAPE